MLYKYSFVHSCKNKICLCSFTAQMTSYSCQLKSRSLTTSTVLLLWNKISNASENIYFIRKYQIATLFAH